MKTRKMVSLSLFLAMGIVLSIIESFIPTGIPGVKIGLANIITLLILYIYGRRDAIIILLLRIFLVGLLYSGLFSQTFLLSLGGGLLSIAIMVIAYSTHKFKILTVSVLGAISHSIGQIIMAIITLSTKELVYYLPIILAISIPAGVLTGLIAKRILDIFKVDEKATSNIGLIIIIISFGIFLGTHFILRSLNTDTEKTANIYYENKLILSLNINNNKVLEQNLNVLDEEGNPILDLKDQNQGLYYVKAYNLDYREWYIITIEVKDSKIRIKSETSRKHICSNQGWTDSKFKPLTCLPNQLYVEIEDFDPNAPDIIS